MNRGKITQIHTDEQYGSIRTERGEDLRFNNQCLWNTRFEDLTVGLEVEFEIQQTRTESLAFHIRPFVPAPAAA